MVLLIAGYKIKISSNFFCFIDEIYDCFSEFAFSPKKTDTISSLRFNFVDPRRTSFFRNSEEHQYPILGGIEKRQQSHHDFTVLHRDVVLFFNPQKRSMEVNLKKDTFEEYRSLVHIYLKLFLSSLLCCDGGILTHGSGFQLSSAGAAFIGKSNFGKSTATNLLSPEALFSDDCLTLTTDKDKVMVHANPLGGLTTIPQPSPLRSIFFPRKANSFHVEPLPPHQAIITYVHEQAKSISKSFEELRGLHFNNVCNLFNSIPAYKIHFPKDFIDKDQIIKLLEA